MQKIAVLSDVHGNIAALEQVVSDIQTRQVDCVFNLGDHISGPLWPKETIEFLMRQDWIQIRGNHDRQLTDQDPLTHGPSDRFAYSRINNTERDWLRSLLSRLEVDRQFLLFHGTPRCDTAYLLETVTNGIVRLATPEEIKERLGEPPLGVCLCGHTHFPRVVEVSGQILIINPGSVGTPAYDDESPCLHVVETGSPHARYALLEYKQNGWKIELVSVPYDYRLAAEQARKNGRPDWEIALKTGFMSRKSEHDGTYFEMP